MGTSHRSAAHVEWRAYELLDPQGLRANGRANDIDDGIGRAHFMEVDLLDADVVDLGFGRAQRLKISLAVLRTLADRRRSDDRQDFAEVRDDAVFMLVS